MEMVFLGTGTSHGIPVIGCQCRVCSSSDPKNKRNRTGLWLHDEEHSLIIDVCSEFRLSCLKFGITQVDRVLITHAHADHTSGMDDLRIFSQKENISIPVSGNEEALNEIRTRFDYAFRPPKNYGGGTPQLKLETAEKLDYKGWNIIPLKLWHGPLPILGYRVENVAFLTDCSAIPDESIRRLDGLEILVLDCLRRRPHSTHLHLEKAVEYAEKIGAKKTYFTHMTHELDHSETENELPPNVYLGYDGLRIKL